MAEGVKRRYDSTRRTAQAHENRLRILEAAHALFVAQGYGATTVAEVAAAAGVAPETVYAAFRTKLTLLRRAWDLAVGGDDREVHLLERPELREVFDEPDLRARLARFARVNTAIMQRTAGLRLAVEHAADGDPAAGELLAEIDRARLDAMGVHARAAAATGRLAVPEATCQDVLVATTDGALWRTLVERRGWSDEDYAGWLARLWVATLVEGVDVGE
ncbi:TetR family transcriptional regulator [Actinomycetospora straminea]|uniref:TetR/AcrR family transcriptional regulator n=1 Tax=Actinomycetospora straminea TaxID=663607 RepID=A0ABP9E0V9_9PSEU|nr:TetR family transcriptional regulator [Actinomycetospora straminea]MDD7934162.1 TetR family transcriptional regulator [Actinomycetospora straminea]